MFSYNNKNSYKPQQYEATWKTGDPIKPEHMVTPQEREFINDLREFLNQDDTVGEAFRAFLAEKRLRS